jgi:membrane-associated phospholipid phosphatase
MRLSERIVVGFFLWASVLALVLPIAPGIRVRALVANGIVFLVCYFLVREKSQAWATPSWFHYLRDWVPQIFLVLAYKEMGWFAPGAHTYELENSWIVWDRVLLNDWHLRAGIEAFGSLLPSLLELSYLVVYVVPPVTLLILYRLRMREKADAMLSIYLLAMFLCYGQFPFWPSEPPRVVFAGEDMPLVDNVIRRFNLWIVGSYGIHTSVFPSAHVAGAVAAALGFWYLTPERRGLVGAYCFYAALVTVATVYGRYHYAVDAVAGVVMAGVAFGLVVGWKRSVGAGVGFR